MARTWKEYGNLAFISNNISLKNHFFYFSTLLSSYERGNNPKYRILANSIGTQAQQLINANSPDNPKNETIWMDRFNYVLKVLNQAKEYELKNEQRYFDDKLAMLDKTFTKEEITSDIGLSTLRDLLNNKAENGFNYSQFITAINIIMQGYKNTKAIFQHELDHLNELENALNNLRESRHRQLRGQDRILASDNQTPDSPGVQRAMKKLEQERIDIYLRKKNIASLRGFKANFGKVRNTSDVTIAQWVTRVLNDIFNNNKFYDQAKKIIQHNFDGTQQAYDLSAQRIKAILIKTVMTYSAKHIHEILNEKYSKKIIPQLLKDITEEIDQTIEMDISGYYDNFGQFGHQLNYFAQGINTLNQQKGGAKGLYDAVIDFITMLEEKDKKAQGSPTAIAIQTIIEGKGIGLKPGEDYSLRNALRLIRRIEERRKEYEKIAKRQKEGKIQGAQKKKLLLGSAGGQKKFLTVIIENGKINITTGALGQLTQVKSFNDIGISQLTTTNFNRFVGALKSKTSKILRHRLDAAITKQKTPQEQHDLFNMLQEGLENIHISVGGPVYSEILQGIQQELQGIKGTKSFHTGKLNLKNDFITVTCFFPTNAFGDLTANFQNKRITAIMDNLEEELADIQERYAIAIRNQLEKNLRKARDNKDYNEFNKVGQEYAKATQLAKEMEEEADKAINTAIQRLNDIKRKTREAGTAALQLEAKRESFLATLKNSCITSSTMKTYNTYQNDIGFVGGSIGSTLTEQLDHLDDIFSAAGAPLSKLDKDWLISAIYNTSRLSVVGEHNKNIIENYLGSLATFALFTEGANELAMLQNDANTIKPLNADYLHLYKLNGIYFPGSYVLTTVIEQVSTMLNLASTAISKNNYKGIIIVNDVNYNMIPNNLPGATELEKKPWQQVAARANASVSLKVLFMAGLLDIVNNLNKTMQEIQLPV